ncbi:fructose-specific PTS transporter subunit EIIC [Mycoplasma putrefaciens]|uniref:PTS fructose transporter subunit IIC n=1 Tax=Mycoplasma putrefaciens TaxID=2123 RepID=UPI003DA5A237
MQCRICLSVSVGVTKAINGANASPVGFLKVIETIGVAAFMLMIPVLAGFIANSIAGRSAIAPAMVGAFIGNNATNFVNWIPGLNQIQTPMGFVGAIIAGLVVGYFVRWVNTWKVPKTLAPAMPIFFVPLTAGILISLLFIYALGAPIGFVMEKFSNFIKQTYQKQNIGLVLGLGLGVLVGAMAGFDMGGPINKIAFVTCSALITQQIYEPMGAMAAAIPVAPLGMGLATVIFKKFFNSAERQMGLAALIMGMIGISEGAIPFAIRDPKRAILCNVLGSAIAGGIAGALKVQDTAAHGGPIVGILGAVPYGIQTVYFFLAIIIGSVITCVSYGLWLLAGVTEKDSVKWAYQMALSNLKQVRKTKLKALKAEINSLKKQTNDKAKLLSLANQVSETKVKFDRDLQQLKATFKKYQKEEDQLLKSHKTEISNYKNQVNQRLTKDIQTINQANDRSDKKSSSAQIIKLKDLAKEQIDNYSKDLKKPIVNKFLQENNLL